MDELTDLVAEERFANLLINNPDKLDDPRVVPELITDKGMNLMMVSAIQLRLTGTDVTPVNIGLESGDPDAESLAAKMMGRELAPGSFNLLLAQLTNLHTRRRASTLCKSFYERCFNLEEEAGDVVSELESKVLDLRKAKSSGIKQGGDMREVRELMEWRVNHPGEVKGMRFGFPKIESLLNGLQGGQLYTIWARPSVGKTSIMTQMILNLIHDGRTPFAASLEMKGVLLKERLLATLSGVSLGVSGEGAFTEDQLRRLTTAISQLEKTNWFYEDSARLDVEDICSKARRLKSEHDIDAVFVDYIQIVGNKKFKPSEARLRVGENTWKFKQLAEELDIPTIILAQVKRKENSFSRATGTTEIPEPELHDLKEAGNIEEDSDVVILLHRDQRENAHYTTARVAKNRNGGTGVVELEFTPETTSFKEESYS